MTEAVAHKSQLTIGLLDFEPLSSFVKGNNIWFFVNDSIDSISQAAKKNSLFWMFPL